MAGVATENGAALALRGLGRRCLGVTCTMRASQSIFDRFMAILSYTYLKLKIPRPAGVITMEARAQQVLDCERAASSWPQLRSPWLS
jgi:hypothetical protein